MGRLRLVSALVGLSACTATTEPPLIQDPDGGIDQGDVAPPVPCAEPSPGCPCLDVGAAVYCGIITRQVGSYVTCQPGYMTCQADGGWSECEGPSVYDGTQ